MHKFAALLTHGLLMTIEILHLKLTSNISTPELWLWIHTFDNSYFVVLFLTGYLKQNSLRTNQFQTITNWLSFIEKIEKLGNKPRLW